MSTASAQSGVRVGLGIAALTAEVEAQLGYLPTVLGATVRERVYDMLSHHRLTVGKSVGRTFPGRRRAQQWILSRTYRFTSPLRELKSSGEGILPAVLGESFYAASTGFLADVDDEFEHLERGGTVSSSDVMAIPTGAGRRAISGGLRTTKQFADKLRRPGGLDVSPTGALFDTEAARKGAGLRSSLYGVLRRRRHQDPILHWYSTFDSVSARHLRRMETDAAFALDFAGRASLAERSEMLKQERAVFRGAFNEALASAGGGSNARTRSKASRVAKDAVREWRRKYAETRKGERA